MGCTASKVVAAAEAGAENNGERMPRPIRRRIEEIRWRQWRERRKDSIVSTTQLLNSDEERDFETPAGSQESIEIVSSSAEKTKEEGEKENRKEEPIEVGDRSPEIGIAAKGTKEKGEGPEKASEMDGIAEEKQEEMEIVPVSETNGTAEKKQEETRAPSPETGGAAAEEEEEEPGSPSFRIFFEQRKWDSDDSALSSSKNKGKNNEKAKEDSDSNVPSTSSHSRSRSRSEGREEMMKSPKKERGRRLKALTKAPSRVNCFLHCYYYDHVNSPKRNVTSADHSSPSPRHSYGN